MLTPCALGQMVGPNYGSRILELMQDVDAALELDADLRELPSRIATDPLFFPTIQNNQAVLRCVEALRFKWFDAQG